MKILALDTATSRCSVALMAENDVRELSADAPRVQAETLLPMVEQLLSEAGLTLASLDAVAFGRGPGAFTGLRVAASVAQGLAFGASLPVLPVSDLAALAAGAGRLHGARQVLACMDARMQELYWCAYNVEGNSVCPLVPESLSRPEEVKAPQEGPWFGAGSGWDAYPVLVGRFTDLSGRDGSLLPAAGDILRLAAGAFRRGEAVSPERAQPVYLRDKVATPKT